MTTINAFQRPLTRGVLRTFCSPANALASTAQRRLMSKKVIPVRLLEDVPGLGRKGTTQQVSPGRMRNDLYRTFKASYLSPSSATDPFGDALASSSAPGSTPASSQSRPEPSTQDLLALQTLLESLPPLVLRRRVTELPAHAQAEPAATTTGRTLHGSVTLADVLDVLRAEHGVEEGTGAGAAAVPAGHAAVVEYELLDGAAGTESALERGRIKRTGEYLVNAHIRPLDARVRLRVVVEPEI